MKTTLSIEGTWRLRAADGKKTVPCPIPGDNYSALQDAGRIPDPYWRDNERKVQWVADTDWIFSRSFDVPASLLAHEAVFLSFDSIDTVAEVFVNGTDCGIVWCAPWYAKVPAAALRKGTNMLEVRVTNTWRNRLIGDCLLPPEKRLTKSCLQYKDGPLNNARGEVSFSNRASGYSANDSLISCGLYGPVELR